MGPKALPLLGLRSFFRGFFKKFPQYSQFNTKRSKDLTNIINQFHFDLGEEIINNRYGIDLPLKCGHIQIVSFKRNRPYFNPSAFTKQNILTSWTNNHTNGLSCKIVYRNRSNRYKLKDKRIWEFKFEAPFKKRVSKAFSLNYNNYIFSPNRAQIKKKSDKFNWKKITDDNIEEFLINYNEFEL